MGDNRGNVGTTGGSAAATVIGFAGLGGLIDVSGITFDRLSEMIGEEDLGRALDYILASGQNGAGYHGFSNHIG